MSDDKRQVPDLCTGGYNMATPDLQFSEGPDGEIVASLPAGAVLEWYCMDCRAKSPSECRLLPAPPSS